MTDTAAERTERKLSELQSPAGRKLTAEALREIRKAKELFRDAVIAARPAVEDIVGPDAWSAILEASEAGLVPWLVSLAPQPAKPQPAKKVSATLRRDNRTGHPGIDQCRGLYRARCWSNGREAFNKSFEALESAVDAREAFLAGRAA